VPGVAPPADGAAPPAGSGVCGVGCAGVGVAGVGWAGVGCAGSGAGVGVDVVGATPPPSGACSCPVPVSGVAVSLGVVALPGAGTGVVVVGTSPRPASRHFSVFLASSSSHCFASFCWKSARVLSMNCFQIEAGYVPPDTGEPRHSVSIGLRRSG
jgi:hypothetical protein